ncbi:hypothetical protein M8J76_013884 [Diaphorina citri]|nr:hypothetical protein M8J76_013884 [Diaphorina citri]KAI5717683.1 hypothetical protein M8J77_009602 [Diaphorina citri]
MLRILLLACAGVLAQAQFSGFPSHGQVWPSHGANFPSHDLNFPTHHISSFAAHDNFPYPAPGVPQHVVTGPIMAVAILNGKDVKGTVLFLQPKPQGPVLISGNITGLTPGDHGFHIHEKGDISQGCASMGPHYNPFNYPHGAPTDPDRHAGDLGSITADKNGFVSLQISDHVLSLDGPLTILGRGVVVHEKADDLGRGDNAESVKTGNAGARLACGIIGRY